MALAFTYFYDLLAHSAFFVHNLAEMIQHLERAGIAVVRDEPLEGYDRVYVADPFGNRIELLEPTDL